MPKYILNAISIVCPMICLMPRLYGTAMEDVVSDMEPGSFAELSTVWPGGQPRNLMKRGNNNTLQYADSASWDPVRKRLLFEGGGHMVARQLILYDEITNTWSEGPALPGGSHGYDHNALNPKTGVLYTSSFNSRAFHAFDQNTDTWSSLPETTYPGPHAITRAYKYFPELGGVVVIDPRRGHIQLYRESTETWEDVAKNLYVNANGGVDGEFYHNVAEYNPVHKVLLFGGGNNGGGRSLNWLWKLDRSGTVTRLKDAPVPIRIVGGGTDGGNLVVDPASGRYLFLTQDGRFFDYCIVSDTWRHIDVDLPAAMTRDPKNVVVNTISSPISTHGVVLYAKYMGQDTKVWLYKHILLLE